MTQQGCCGDETSTSRDCGDREKGNSPEIETQQGCCGEGSTQPESTCCSDTLSNDPKNIETQQGCCEDGATQGDFSRSEIQNDCCGDPSAGQSSCGDGSSDPHNELKRNSVEANQKSPSERERIQTAGEHTEALLAEMADTWTPDWTESDVSEFLHDRLRQKEYDAAWTWKYCPAVHAGSNAGVGHTLPGDRTLSAGELLHVDFGVKYNGSVADLQRLYYYPPEPDEPIPDELQAAFEDVRAAIDAGRKALEPGVRGHEVDAAAREELTDRGWSNFNHAFGHQVGHIAHDSGTLLGPQWERFGNNPYGEVRVDEVYSIELGVGTTYGYVGQEEMVRVVDDGNEFIVEPQTSVRRLKGN